MECTLNPRVLIRALCCCFRLLLPSKWFKLHILAILGFCGWEVGLNVIESCVLPTPYIVSNMFFGTVSFEACWVSVPSQQQKQGRAVSAFTVVVGCSFKPCKCVIIVQQNTGGRRGLSRVPFSDEETECPKSYDFPSGPGRKCERDN